MQDPCEDRAVKSGPAGSGEVETTAAAGRSTAEQGSCSAAGLAG